MHQSYSDIDILNVKQPNLINTIRNITVLLFVLSYWINALWSVFICFILIALTLLNIFTNQSKNLHFSGIDVLLFAYLLFALIPTVLHGRYEPYFKVVLYPCTVFFIFSNIDFNHKILIRIVYATLISTSAIVIVMYFQDHYGSFNFSMEHILTQKRGNRGFWFISSDSKVGPTTIASIIVVTGLLFYSLLLRSMKFAFMKAIGLVLSIFFLIMVSGRTAYVAFAIAIFTMHIFSPLEKKSTKTIRAILFLSFSIGSLGLANYLLTHVFSSGELRRLSFFTDLFTTGSFSDVSMWTRIFLWTAAMKMASRSFFGYGYDSFGDNFNLSTHNEILGQLIGGGWIATCCFLAIYVYMWFLALKLRKLGISETGYVITFVLALIVVAFVIGLTENYSKSSSNILHPLFWFYFGTLVAIDRKFGTTIHTDRKFKANKNEKNVRSILCKNTPTTRGF